MVITHIRDVRGDYISWLSLGKRFQKFREAYSISRVEAAQEINVTENTIIGLEEGHDRKSTNILWSISIRWNLSVNWLLNGLGAPHDPDPVDLMPETLHVQKGAGIRRNKDRADAEEGNYTDHVLEFVMAVDKFKTRYTVPFPTLTQIYEIVTALGYRKSVPPRIAPLGYIVEHQQWAEKLKHMNEKIEKGLDLEDKEEQRATASVAEKQKFILTDPEGRQFFVENLPQFCHSNQLSAAHIYSIASGQRKQHKGWRAEVAPFKLGLAPK